MAGSSTRSAVFDYSLTVVAAERQCKSKRSSFDESAFRVKLGSGIAEKHASETMPRPKILVFQHVPFEPLGTLDPLLKESGFRIRYVNFGREPESRPALEKYEALIVLGGPMNSDQIASYPNLITEVEIIREALQRDMSILGVCLGAQLLAKAVGGSVSRNPSREIGWCDVDLTESGATDPVLSCFAPRQQVFQWHEDGITLPPEAVHLASSPASTVQAFRYGKHAYGFQFHLEASQSLIERWLSVPDHQGVLDEEQGHISAAAIREQTTDSIKPLQELSRKTFSRWIDQFEIRPRQRRLPSR